MQLARNVAASVFVVLWMVLGAVPALANDCTAMADLAYDAAKLRDAGVPIASVQARLSRDVKKIDELAMALMVLRLVYRTEGTAQQLQVAILEKCNTSTR